MIQDKNFFAGRTIQIFNIHTWGNERDVPVVGTVTNVPISTYCTRRNYARMGCVGSYALAVEICVWTVPQANCFSLVAAAASVKSTMTVGRCQTHDRIASHTTNTNTLEQEIYRIFSKIWNVYKDYKGLAICPDWNCYEKVWFRLLKTVGGDSTQT